MPLITIDSFPPTDAAEIPRMIAAVRSQAALATKEPPDNLWVLFRPIAPGHYSAGETRPDPPIVVIRAKAGRSREARGALVAAVTAAVARALRVPSENIWAHYQEMAPEDVWFEGHWPAGRDR